VLPGGILTERQRRLWFTPEYMREILAAQALKRSLVPEDVARLVLFLAADDKPSHHQPELRHRWRLGLSAGFTARSPWFR